MIRWVLAFVLLGASAHAQSFPALFDVTGVSSDDTLNVRTAPNLDADTLMTLAPAQTDVEVIDTNAAGTWGLVNTNEQSGWASLQFLTRQTGQTDGDFPDLTACYGTEPFWDIDLSGASPIMSIMGEGTQMLAPINPIKSSNRTDRFAFTTSGMTAFVARQSCNDGMSDRQFGLSIDVLLFNDSGKVLLSGCCSIAP